MGVVQIWRVTEDGLRFERVASVDSTSEALKRLVTNGERDEVALLAGVQTEGRGRLGRRWESPPGNLYLSVLLRPGRIRAPGHWSILAAVVLAEAVAKHVEKPETVRLKWPNDLVVDGAKVAGILLEAGDDNGPWLLMGFGVNLVSAPAGLDRPTSAIGAVAPEALAQDVLEQVEIWRGQYAADGFEPVRTAWLERGPALDERVATTFNGRVIEGAFAGLAASGGMRLDTPTGPRTIVTGELF